MLQTRWGGIAARLSSQNARFATRTRAGVSYRAFSGPRAPITLERVQLARSRVLSLRALTPASIESTSRTATGRSQKVLTALPLNGEILHSAFPTKTVIFLVVFCAAAYYLLDVSLIEEDWADQVLASFTGDPAAAPLHFYKDREEVDHWVHHHKPDPSAPLKDPEVLRQISEQFPKIAYGWEIQEDESREFDIPITHGIRFRSNDPCVSSRFSDNWSPAL